MEKVTPEGETKKEMGLEVQVNMGGGKKM